MIWAPPTLRTTNAKKSLSGVAPESTDVFWILRPCGQIGPRLSRRSDRKRSNVEHGGVIQINLDNPCSPDHLQVVGMQARLVPQSNAWRIRLWSAFDRGIHPGCYLFPDTQVPWLGCLSADGARGSATNFRPVISDPVIPWAIRIPRNVLDGDADELRSRAYSGRSRSSTAVTLIILLYFID